MNLNKKNMKNMMLLITFAAFMLWLVFNYESFINLLLFIIELFFPILLGIAIAFVINVPMKLIERKIFKVEIRKKKKLIRIISLILSIILFIGIIGLIMFLIVPEVIEAIINISETFSTNTNFVSNGISKFMNLFPDLKDYFKDVDYENIINASIETAGDIINVLISFVSSLVSKVFGFFVSFILAIYILIDKEQLTMQAKKILLAFFKEEVAIEIVRIIKITNMAFTNFITGQCLDAVLIGFLFFVLLSLFGMPYAFILGVLFTVTALVPYVGAFVTLVVGTVLIAVTNPISALWYVLIFFLVQQIDENFTYPKIVGGSVGLPAIWAIIAVLIGGSIFGFIGMFISIPIASILYGLFKELVNEKLRKKFSKQS